MWKRLKPIKYKGKYIQVSVNDSRTSKSYIWTISSKKSAVFSDDIIADSGNKNLNSKSSAVNDAKKYMGSHPNG